MRQQRFQEILQDVRRVSWADVILLAKKNFQKEHPGEEAEAFFECEFYCNWRYKVPKTDIAPQGIVSCLEALSDEAVFTYKVDNRYAPEAECSIRFDDPQLDIKWPISHPEEMLLSEKDLKHAVAFSEAELF